MAADFAATGRVMVRAHIRDAAYPLVAGDMGTVLEVYEHTVIVLFDKYPSQERKVSKCLLIP